MHSSNVILEINKKMINLQRALGIAGLILLSYTSAESLPRNNYNFPYSRPSPLADVAREPTIQIRCVIFNKDKTDVYNYYYPQGSLEKIDSVPHNLENVSRLIEISYVPDCDKVNLLDRLR